MQTDSSTVFADSLVDTCVSSSSSWEEMGLTLALASGPRWDRCWYLGGMRNLDHERTYPSSPHGPFSTTPNGTKKIQEVIAFNPWKPWSRQSAGFSKNLGFFFSEQLLVSWTENASLRRPQFYLGLVSVYFGISLQWKEALSDGCYGISVSPNHTQVKAASMVNTHQRWHLILSIYLYTV